MNIGEHALKIRAKSNITAPVQEKRPRKIAKGRQLMMDRKDEVAEILRKGGGASSVGRLLGVSHSTVTRWLDKVIGEGANDKARKNGKLQSTVGLKGRTHDAENFKYN